MKKAIIKKTKSWFLGERFYFTLVASNGEPIATSERYKSKQSATTTIQQNFPNFTIQDETTK